MKPLEVKIPNHRNYGEVRENGDNIKVFRPNTKSMATLLSITGTLLIAVFVASTWIYNQTTVQADTTETVKVLESKVDTLENEARIKQRSLDEKLTWIMQHLDPDGADRKIGEINAREKTQLDDYKEKKRTDGE